MNKEIVQRITKSPKRRSLFHFTRVDNLASIAHVNALYASATIQPNPLGQRRTTKQVYRLQNNAFIVNAHLHIDNRMMHPDTDIGRFRAYLDQYVFLWPTFRLCQEMIRTYSRREPNVGFAVLQLDAYTLLLDHYDAVRLSKYDSGSMPRYPARTSYRKSLRMFLPLDEFGTLTDTLVPRVPSEIHEILVFRQVSGLGHYLQGIYSECVDHLPAKWARFHRRWHQIDTSS